jgi:protein-tyrosine kinase
VPEPALAAPAPRAPGGTALARTAMPLLGALEIDEDVARQMASLRVSLDVVLGARSPRVVAFLGSQGGEGVTTVALQFAQVLARDPEARPLLVDCHAVRPAFEVDTARRCAVLDAQLLARPAESAAVVTPNLFVVPVSDESRHAGLVQTSILRQLLETNGPGFDWILLDAPPGLDSPDATALGAVADGVVLVLQAGRTKRPILARAADLLGKGGARTIGSVLNRRVLEIPEFIYRRI